MSTITTITTVPEGLTMEGKIDFMMKMMIQSEAARIEDRKTICKLEDNVKCLNKEVKELRVLLNNSDQQARGKSLRLFGVPLTPEEAANAGPEAYKALSKRVYVIIKPMLAAAKNNKGELDTVPQLNNVVEDCFRVGRWDAKSPPAIIIVFTNRRIRMAVLRHKKLNLPQPTDEDKKKGTVKFLLVEDLTGPTYKKLRELQLDERVDRAWTMDGSIRFISCGDKSGTIKRVKSVFESVDSIINNK